jgi:hypothetical protein
VYCLVCVYPLLSEPQGGRTAAVPADLLVSLELDSNADDLALGVDESYELTVLFPVVKIRAGTPFGAMHALETLQQLRSADVDVTTGYTSVPTHVSIVDAPRFPWRGLMVDTARQFMPVPALLRQIEGLSMNKMNVFHWHIVDSQVYILFLTGIIYIFLSFLPGIYFFISFFTGIYFFLSFLPVSISFFLAGIFIGVPLRKQSVAPTPGSGSVLAAREVQSGGRGACGVLRAGAGGARHP